MRSFLRSKRVLSFLAVFIVASLVLVAAVTQSDGKDEYVSTTPITATITEQKPSVVKRQDVHLASLNQQELERAYTVAVFEHEIEKQRVAEEARQAEVARQAAIAEQARQDELARQRAATTTTAPPTTQAPAPAPQQAPVATQGTGRCGGDLPPCYVMERESGGDPRIWNGSCYAPVGHLGTSPCGSSSASGIWQFVRGTWNGYGGYVNAADAPASVQNAKARELWAGGAGCGHWSACG